MAKNPINEEFAREIIAIQNMFGLEFQDYAAMLLGAAVLVAKRSGMNKGSIITVASNLYDEVENV